MPLPLASRPLDASVIICTHNRSAALQQTLEALTKLTIPFDLRYEILIIDNASTDGTIAVIERAAGKLPIHYLFEKQPGAGRARNKGILQAKGRVIFITDDDCIPEPDWLEIGIGLLASNQRQLIGGRVDLHDPSDLPITIKTETDPQELTSVANIFGFLHSCNMILGHCVLDEIGLFDPLLGPGTPCCAADDTDLIYRAFRAGVPIRYRPELRIAHAHGRKSPVDGERLRRNYAIANGAITLKHLIHGRLDLLRIVYWEFRGNREVGSPNFLRNHIKGALAYLRGSLSLK